MATLTTRILAADQPTGRLSSRKGVCLRKTALNQREHPMIKKLVALITFGCLLSGLGVSQQVQVPVTLQAPQADTCPLSKPRALAE